MDHGAPRACGADETRFLRKLPLALISLVAMFAGLLVVLTPVADAANPLPAPITDYDNYPSDIVPSLIPDGCDAEGFNIITGATYTVGGISAGDLGAFTLHAGDTITMTWSGWAQGCEGARISLAAKATLQPIFVPNDNQKLLVFDACGGDGPSCANQARGFGPLTITIPSLEETCNFQIDSVIGPPLETVGPDGSYYGRGLRLDNGKPDGPSMLISANNGGAGECVFPPTASAELDCTLIDGAPGVRVTVTNPDQDDSAVVDILKNGVVVFDDVSIAADGSVTRDIPFANGETALVTVEDTIGETEIFSQEFTSNCLNPAVSPTMSCAAGGVQVHLSNTDAIETANFTVIVDGTGTLHSVAGGGSEDFTIPVAENQTVHVTITHDGMTFIDDDFTMDCFNPAASATKSCAEGGVVVHLSNTGAQQPVTFVVTVDGTSTQHVVAADGSEDFTVPVDEGETVHVTITQGDATFVDDDFTMDCYDSSAGVESVCASGGKGAKFTFTNDGELPVDLTVTKNGTVIDTVTVAPGASETRTYPMAEDETATFRVTGTDFDTGDQTITLDCAEVETTTLTPTTTSPPPVVTDRALARTGIDDARPLVTIAGLLLMAGGLVLFFANRSAASPAPTRDAKSRGR